MFFVRWSRPELDRSDKNILREGAATMNTENGLPLLTSTLLAATGLLVVSLVLLFWLSINFTGELDFEPGGNGDSFHKPVARQLQSV
jgi:hypothetical protein